MNSITVNVAELSEIILKGRKVHEEEYKKAVEGFHIEAREQLERLLKKVDKRTKSIQLILMYPECHLTDYDQALEMLKMHQGETITLTNTEFSHYVKNQWRWRDQWVTSNSAYLSKMGK